MAKKVSELAKQSSQRVQAYHKCFSGPDGALVLNDLMRVHSVLNSTFTGNVNETLLKEGERNVVLRILTILKTNPNKFLERIEKDEDSVVD